MFWDGIVWPKSEDLSSRSAEDRANENATFSLCLPPITSTIVTHLNRVNLGCFTRISGVGVKTTEILKRYFRKKHPQNPRNLPQIDGFGVKIVDFRPKNKEKGGQHDEKRTKEVNIYESASLSGTIDRSKVAGPLLPSFCPCANRRKF